MPSAVFTVNAAAVSGAVSVTKNTSVALALADTTGVGSVAWSIVGSSDSSLTNPTITPAGTPSGVTATFTIDNADGVAYIVQAVVNGGKDANGRVVSAQTFRAVVGTLQNGRVPFCAGETTERDATHGWTPALNDAIAASAALTAPDNPGDDGKVYVADSGLAVPSSDLVITSGSPSLNNGKYYRSKLTGGTWVSLIGIDVNDDIVIGASSGIDDVVYLAADAHEFRCAGTTEFQVSAGLVNCQNNEIRTTGFISVGASPATQGGLRLANGTDGAIYFRNFAGDASYLGLRLSSAGNVLDLGDALIPTTRALASTVFRVTIGATNELEVSAGLVDCKDNQIATSGYVRVTGSGYVGVGATATIPGSGLVRLQQNMGGIRFRNFAGDGDIPALEIDTDDRLALGGTGATGVVAVADSGYEVPLTPVHEPTASTVAASGTSTLTVAVASNTIKTILAEVTFDDGTDTQYLLRSVKVRNRGGTLTLLKDDLTEDYGGLTGATFTAAISGTDVIFTATNGSAGSWECSGIRANEVFEAIP